MHDKIAKVLSDIWDDKTDIIIVFGIIVALILGYGSPLILWLFGSEEWGILSWEFWLSLWGWSLYIISIFIGWLIFVMFGGTSDDW